MESLGITQTTSSSTDFSTDQYAGFQRPVIDGAIPITPAMAETQHTEDHSKSHMDPPAAVANMSPWMWILLIVIIVMIIKNMK